MISFNKAIAFFLVLLILSGCATVRRTSQGTVPPAPVREKKKPVVTDDSPRYLRYIVQRGDTLWEISQMAYNDSGKWKRILEANRDKIKDVKSLKPGEIIIIPIE